MFLKYVLPPFNVENVLSGVEVGTRSTHKMFKSLFKFR